MEFNDRQQMLTLAFISYAGMYGRPTRDPLFLYQAFALLLRNVEPAQNWTIAWGPGVYKSEKDKKTDTNVMFIAKSSAPSSGFAAEYAVVIRGTNPLSLTDMMTQDSDIYVQKRWKYGFPPCKAKIARGVDDALKILQQLVPQRPLPGAGTSPLQFLRHEVAQADGPVRVLVTGHSLGGTLATLVSLWLRDTQGVATHDGISWDPENRATVAPFPIAGFSPGTPSFARYYAERLGEISDRIYSRYDAIPLMYNPRDLRRMSTLYVPTAPASTLFRSFIDFTIARIRVAGLRYVQVQRNAEPLPGGSVDPKFTDFTLQMLYQHTDGYVNELELQSYINLLEIFTAGNVAVASARLMMDGQPATRAEGFTVELSPEGLVEGIDASITQPDPDGRFSVGLFAKDLPQLLRDANLRAVPVLVDYNGMKAPVSVMLPTLSHPQADHVENVLRVQI